uniref:Uncharacterized protein n=1 Tax=Anguilla anguilla TaxID=7936 RepID=A0A0E9Y0Q6_ANGAN
MDVWKVLFHCPTRQTTKFREYVLEGPTLHGFGAGGAMAGELE